MNNLRIILGIMIAPWCRGLLVCLLCFDTICCAEQQVAEKHLRFILVGDSTVAKESGWGDAFLDRLTGHATGLNLGHGGTSSKSFRALGDWDRVLNSQPTHILIQFGHNDMPAKGPERATDAATTYRDNLVRYIIEARAIGAQPILITSLVRRTFSGQTLTDLLAPYADAVRHVAQQHQVPLIDLHARSKTLVEQLGPEGCIALSPQPKNGQADNTHLSALGGKVFANLVINELISAVPDLAPYVAQIAPLPQQRAGRQWFIAPHGNDAAVGTIDQPFASLMRAQQVAEPGDIVYLRGGTYHLDNSHIMGNDGLFARIIVLNKSGETGKRIFYCAYPQEEPVIDCSKVTPPDQRITAFYVSGSWIHLQGISVTGVQVTMPKHTQSICFENQGSHNTYEQLKMHHGQAIGIYNIRGRDNLILNCDAWANHDVTSEEGKGGNVDGFGAHPSKGSTGNIFRGCRAWWNSDDGFDCINASETVIFEHCWAFANGLSPAGEKLADGNGFKAGGYGSTPVERLPKSIPRHIVRGCVAVDNRNSGFYANHHLTGCDWLNNSAYRNGMNFNLLNRLTDNKTDVPGFDHRLHNNMSYHSRHHIVHYKPEQNHTSHNSFDMEITITEGDFMSSDVSELQWPRQADGSLPQINFLHPSQNSVLINRGADVDLPYVGSHPDLGAFERR